MKKTGLIGGWIMCALVAFVMTSPCVLAETTVDTYEGSNVAEADLDYFCWVIQPRNPQYYYNHNNGDSVAFPMYNKYLDQRPAGSPGLTFASGIYAEYGGTGYGWGGLHYYSTGMSIGWQFGTFRPGFPVYDGTSVDVTYMAYIYDTNLNFLCYVDLDVTFYFV